jgi:hypothetical protein
MKLYFDDNYLITMVGLGNWFTTKGHTSKGTVICVRGILFTPFLLTFHHHGLINLGRYTTWVPCNEEINNVENIRKFQRDILAGVNDIKLEKRK